MQGWLEGVETALFASSFWKEDAGMEIIAGIIIPLATQGIITEDGNLLEATDQVTVRLLLVSLFNSFQ